MKRPQMRGKNGNKFCTSVVSERPPACLFRRDRTSRESRRCYRFPPARCTWQNDVVSGLSKHHRSPVFPTSYPQLEEQLNGIKWRDGKRAVEEEEEEEEEKEEERNGGKRKKGVGGTLDSCQMLIKAKERKTLVSACRKGVASREISHSLSLSLSPFSPTASACLHLHRRRWSMCRLDTAGRGACARIFILRELRRLYNLPVVRRYEASMRSRGCSTVAVCRPRSPGGGG